MIKQCKCGSTNFIVDEVIAHSAKIDKDGILTCVGGCDESEILKVWCKKCDRMYKEKDFKQINF